MKRIYDTIKETTLWRGVEYTIDGVPQTVDPPLVMLTETKLPDPTFDPAIEALVRGSRADVLNELWVEEATVRQLTADEIAAAARKVWPTSADYLIEFTFEEMAVISLSQDPTIAASRLLMASWAGEVWSDDPRVLAGIEALITQGIISQARANEILSKD